MRAARALARAHKDQLNRRRNRSPLTGGSQSANHRCNLLADVRPVAAELSPQAILGGWRSAVEARAARTQP